MKPGRELDALIAEKVMGLKRSDHWPVVDLREDRSRPLDRWDDDQGNIVPLPAYSTSIEAAWEVVEKIASLKNCWRLRLEKHPQGWSVDFETEWKVELVAETAPHAICLAALKAMGA